MTLEECGVRDLLKSGEYEFLDREAMDPQEAYRRTFSADVFLMSANAITEDGEPLQRGRQRQPGSRPDLWP